MIALLSTEFNISWTPQAVATLEQNLNFLEAKRSEAEVIRFKIPVERFSYPLSVFGCV